MRADFYYRLSSDVIRIPSLRQRIRETPEELGHLVHRLVSRMMGGAAADVADGILTTIRHEPGTGYSWPGNVRELEQCIRRILLTGSYLPASTARPEKQMDRICRGIETESYPARSLLADYCLLLHSRHGTFEEVARRTGLDRRTVRKHIESAQRATVPQSG
jgi:DNA-binding NtrC family response regulator